MVQPISKTPSPVSFFLRQLASENPSSPPLRSSHGRVTFHSLTGRSMDHLPILAGEDSEADVFMLRQAFAKARLLNPLHVVSDGEQVMNYLKGLGPYADRKNYPFPGLLLLDMRMPKMDGMQTLAAIRKDPELKRLIVICLSGSANERDVNQAFDLRANSYLVKPDNTDSMTDILLRLKNYWLMLNQFPRSSAAWMTL